MRHRWTIHGVAMLAALATTACSRVAARSHPVPEERGWPGTIAFGGDVIVARRFHVAFDETGPLRPLSALRPWLGRSDLVLANLEAVLSDRGAFRNRRQQRQYTFRGRPELVRVLAAGGIDVVTLANNHTGDYGAEGLRDTIEILDRARIAHVGAGASVEEARRPAFFRVGQAVVAILGVSAVARRYASGPARAGTNYLDPHRPDRFVRSIAADVRRARRFAHVVLLTVHWGPNFVEEPSSGRRVLASRLVREAGVDAILGHSAHLVQGVEIVDGRPVIYDAGNLCTDFRVDKPSALFLIEVDRVGARRVEAIPIRTWASSAEPARGEEARKILNALRERSEALGTRVALDGNRAVIAALRPEKGRPPPEADWRPPSPAPPTDPTRVRLPGPTGVRLPDPTGVRLPDPTRVPSCVLRRPPPRMTPRPVRFENGMELLGYEIETPRVVRGHGAVVTTWWTSKRPIPGSSRVRLLVVPPARTTPRSQEFHQPGDWSWPTPRWRPGQVVEDRILIRTAGNEPGPHVVLVAVESAGGAFVSPVDPADLDRGLGVRLAEIEIEGESAGCNG